MKKIRVKPIVGLALVGTILIVGSAKACMQQNKVRALNERCAIKVADNSKIYELETTKERDEYVIQYEADYYTSAIIEGNVEAFKEGSRPIKEVNCLDYENREKVKVKLER